MSQVRRLAIVLMTVSVVTAAVYATGAFTSLTAQRDANIQVTGDASGYLSLQPAPGPNGAYATQRGGKLRVSVGSTLGHQGGGVNKQAMTVIRDIFTITNHGTQPVKVWLTDESTAVTFTGGTKGEPLEGRKQAVPLAPEETLFVGLTVDTSERTDRDIIKSVTIHADSDIASAQDGASGSGSVSERTISDRTVSERTISDRTVSDRAPKSGDNGGFIATIQDLLTQSEGKETVSFETMLSTASGVPFSDLLSEPKADTSEPPATPVPRHAPTPSEDDDDSSATDDGVPRHAPTNPNGDSGFNYPFSSSDTVKTAALIFVVALPVDGLGPTDEVAAVGWTTKEILTAIGIAGGIFGGFSFLEQATDEQTKHREDETNQQQQEHEETQSNQQTEKGDDKSDGRRKLKPPKPRPPLVPDGGKDDHPLGYDALRKQGVPEESIEEWEDKGYDLQQMSEALETYRNSGETLHSARHEAKGELGEILAKPEVMSDYPRSGGYKYHQGVKLNKGAEGEIDWVVVDTSTGDVVATYQVKTHPHKASNAEDQAMDVKDEFKNGNVHQIDNAPDSLTVTDFTGNINEIDRYTIGPKDGHGYDETYDLTRAELETLLDAIREDDL